MWPRSILGVAATLSCCVVGDVWAQDVAPGNAAPQSVIAAESIAKYLEFRAAVTKEVPVLALCHPAVRASIKASDRESLIENGYAVRVDTTCVGEAPVMVAGRQVPVLVIGDFVRLEAGGRIAAGLATTRCTSIPEQAELSTEGALHVTSITFFRPIAGHGCTERTERRP